MFLPHSPAQIIFLVIKHLFAWPNIQVCKKPNQQNKCWQCMFQQTSSVQLPFLCCNCTKTLWLELGNYQYAAFCFHKNDSVGQPTVQIPKEEAVVLTFKNQEPANVWHFWLQWLINYQNNRQFIFFWLTNQCSSNQDNTLPEPINTFTTVATIRSVWSCLWISVTLSLKWKMWAQTKQEHAGKHAHRHTHNAQACKSKTILPS